MSWMNHYQVPDTIPWQGRQDVPAHACIFQAIQLCDLKKPIASPPLPAFALLGFCCDEGIKRNLGRIGAANAPLVIREILAKLPLQRADITLLDAGNILCTNRNLEDAQIALSEAVALLLEKNITPILLGGGHEIAYGHYLGIRKYYTKQQLGIVNFDAHFDMRPLLPNQQGSSGTPFLQIAEAEKKINLHFDYNCIGIQPTGNITLLFETAKKYAAHFLTADDFYQHPIKNNSHFIDRIIQNNDIIYTSLCLDVFAAAFAPGVSAPQTFGLTPWQVLLLLRQLAASKKVVSYDIAELSPPLDIDQRTAKLAANFIYQIIHHHVGKLT